MLQALRQAYAQSLVGMLVSGLVRAVRALCAGSFLWSWLTSPLPVPPDRWAGSALGRLAGRARDGLAAAWARVDRRGTVPALAGRAATAGLAVIALLVALVPVKRQVGPVPVSIEVLLIPAVAGAWLVHWALRPAAPDRADPSPGTRGAGPGAAGDQGDSAAGEVGRAGGARTCDAGTSGGTAGRQATMGEAGDGPGAAVEAGSAGEGTGGGPGLARSRVGLPVTSFDLPFALYLAILALSLVQARSLLEGLQTLARQASFFVLFYIAVDLLRGRRRAAAWVVDATLAGGLLVALIGLVQYVLGIDLSVSGLAGAGAGAVRGRIGSTQENPNFLSEYLILLIPVAMARLLATWRPAAAEEPAGAGVSGDLGPAGATSGALRGSGRPGPGAAGGAGAPATGSRGPGIPAGGAADSPPSGARRSSAGWRRVFYAATLLAMLVAEFLTYTRGGWLGLAVAVAVFVLLVDARYMVAVAAAGAAAVVLVPGMLERLAGMLDFSEGSGAFRLNLYRAALIMWSRSPWIGVGAGNYLEFYPDVIRDFPLLDQRFATYSSHNAFLTVAAETGVLGLAVFLVILALALRVAFSGWRHGRRAEDRLLYLGGGCGMIAFLVQSLSNITFFHPRVALYYWLLLAVLVALLPSVVPAAPAGNGGPGATGATSRTAGRAA